MKDGVIADFDVTESMLRYFIQKAAAKKGDVTPRIAIWVPYVVTEVEKRAIEEAARILSRANAQVELERKAAADDMKKEMIALASLMAEKAVAGAVDAKVQDTMVESTLKEIGEDTWRK